MASLGRALYALPMLLPTALMIRAMAMTGPLTPVVEEAYSEGRYVLQNGTHVPILRAFFGVPALDDTFARISICFGQLVFDDDPTMWWQCLVFIADYAGLCAIWMLESLRNANRGTLFQTSAVPLFIAQTISLGITTPSYFYLFYLLSPLQKYSTASARQIGSAGALAVLPALLVAFFIPHVVSLVHPDFEVRHWMNWIWQVFPVWGSILLFAISNAIRPFLDNRVEAVQRRNKTAIRTIGGLMIALSATCYWSMILFSPLSVSEVLIPKYLIEIPEITIKEWNSVATWQWDIPEDDVCGICQVHFDGTCPTCKYPGDDCSLLSGKCGHNFHMHCIMEWIKQESAKGQCPMCRQPFEWQDQDKVNEAPTQTE
ncbi:Anaphase-promoting complex subunit 11 [Trichoderma ghanense]|uniref:Anaphase-promoting complex subunit 11 n=1 Tax=Trichoderma ghanense TaxID=65468 RepID=A0ABY2H4W1_9HYPO